jgi:aspartate ammonia-lyase
MNTKYIIANIKIPLMLNDDGTYVVLSENTEIKFSSFVGELHTNDKKDGSAELSNLMSSLLSDSKIVDASAVLEEVSDNFQSVICKNVTFKRCSKKNATSKHTIKKYA